MYFFCMEHLLVFPTTLQIPNQKPIPVFRHDRALVCTVASHVPALMSREIHDVHEIPLPDVTVGDQSGSRVGEGRRRRLSPRQTGRADFPHPAFPETLTMKHARKHATLGFIASGVLRQKLLSHNRGKPQVELPSSCHHESPAGFLGSTRISRFIATMNPSDSRMDRPAVIYSRLTLTSGLRRRSSARVSQVSDCSVDARCPLSPRGARPLHRFVASRSMAGFTLFGRLATPKCVTRPNRVHVNITAGILAFRGFGRRIAPTPAQSATWRTNNFHG